MYHIFYLTFFLLLRIRVRVHVYAYIHTYIRVNVATFNETIRFNSITHGKITSNATIPSIYKRIVSRRVASRRFDSISIVNISALTKRIVERRICVGSTPVVRLFSLRLLYYFVSIHFFITLQNYIHQSLFFFYLYFYNTFPNVVSGNTRFYPFHSFAIYLQYTWWYIK